MGASTQVALTEEMLGLRLDQALADGGVFVSRSAAARAIEQGLVLVNGSPALKRQVVRSTDSITVLEHEAPTHHALGEEIPLDIRYEDEHLLVFSKQIGLVCHPDENHHEGTLVDALINHCGVEHLCNLQGQDDRPGIVHRLDKNTSGLMLAAKTNEAGEVLMEAMKEHLVDRRYLALVHGVFSVDSGLIQAPIARSAVDRKKMAIRDIPGAREASTSFKVLARVNDEAYEHRYSLIECKLNTGRTHQIRVHLEFTKHPLVGETAYRSGSPRSLEAQLGLEHQFLHSYYLCFTHPITGAELRFWDNLPDDLRAALARTDFSPENCTEYGKSVFEQLTEAPYPAIQGEM